MSEQMQPPAPPPNDQTPPTPPSAGESEHMMAMWAHIGGAIMSLICITALLAWVPALIIFFTGKDKSRFVGFHSLQSA